MLTLAAMVIAGVHAPASAQDAHGFDVIIEGGSHANTVHLVGDDHDPEADDNGSGAVHHHHCSAMTLPEATGPITDAWLGRVSYVPADPNVLASLPPSLLIDPPSA